jgi:hypothetical protein
MTLPSEKKLKANIQSEIRFGLAGPSSIDDDGDDVDDFECEFCGDYYCEGECLDESDDE